MSINRLIAKGIDPIDPLGAYNRGYQQNQQRQDNQLALQGRNQIQAHRQENQQMKSQEYQIKGVASLAKYLDTLPEEQREQAFQTATQKMPSMGIQQPPPGSTYESMKSKMEMAKLRVYGTPEAPDIKQFGGEDIMYQNGTEIARTPTSVAAKQTGTSEFERLTMAQLRSGEITPAEYNERMNKRSEVLAGTGMRITDETRIKEQKRAAGFKETADIRDEYEGGVEHFKNMDSTIDEAIIAMDSGDTGLSDVMLNRVMSQVQDDNIRAFEAMKQFDKPFGNIANRVAEGIERFLSGKRSDEEKAEIRNTLSYFKEAYAQPKRKAMRERYRALAVESGRDPFVAVPPTSPEDVAETTLVDRRRKKELLLLYFPEMFEK